MDRKTCISVLMLGLVTGFVGGVLSLLVLARPLLQFIKLKTIHAETIMVDESIESKFVHAKVIKADDYLESKVVHGKVNRGEQFLLLDEKGSPRGRWMYDTDGQPSLFLSDKEGRSQTELVVTPNGSAGLRIFGKEKFSVKLMGGEIIPQLELFDEAGKEMVSLGKFYPEDSPHLTFVDKKGPYKTSMAKQITDLESYNKYIRIVPYCDDKPYQAGCERFLEVFMRFCKNNPDGHGCENLKKD